MSRTFNIKLPATDILTDAINASNEGNQGFIPYRHGQLFFRDVAPNTEKAHGDTMVSISDDEHAEDSDWLKVYYDRIPISKFIREESPTMPYHSDYTDLHSMLTDINRKYGIFLVVKDIENHHINLENASGGTYTVPVHSHPNALLMRGVTGIRLTGVPLRDDEKPAESASEASAE